MATRAYVQRELTLQDDKDVVLKPLPIGRLRRFMDAWEKMADLKGDEDGFDIFINCCGIALEENFKGTFDALKATPSEQAEGQFLSAEYKDYLENVLDIDTIYVIIEVCGGIKLNDPKLAAALTEAENQ